MVVNAQVVISDFPLILIRTGTIDDLKSLLWQHYGDEIVEMHSAIMVEQQKLEESDEFDDETILDVE